MQKIIFEQEGGLVALITPTGDLPFEEVCRKDVPAGAPYLVIDESDVPEDWSFRNAWEADFSNPDGYGIGADAWFAEKAAAEAAEQTEEAPE
jgi:hypothetical protein